MAFSAGALAMWTTVTPDRGVIKRIIRYPTGPSPPPGSLPSSVTIHYTIRATPTVGAPAPDSPSPPASSTVANGEVLEDSRTCRRRRGRPLTVTIGAAAVLPGLEALAGTLGRGEVALGLIAPAWGHGATPASRRRRPALATATLLVTVERVEPCLHPPGKTICRHGMADLPTPTARDGGGVSTELTFAHGHNSCHGRMATGVDASDAEKRSRPARVALNGKLRDGCQDDVDAATSVSDVTSDDELDPQIPIRGWKGTPF